MASTVSGAPPITIIRIQKERKEKDFKERKI
jgi:hypothetical protein